MTIDRVRDLCLGLPEVTEDMPFGPGVLVFRIRSKIFALLPLDTLPHTLNLKCDPARALRLRERYTTITPGYHMNKKHWNTLVLDSDLPDALMEELVLHSYDLVKHGTSRTRR